jgi:hypothetical protein
VAKIIKVIMFVSFSGIGPNIGPSEIPETRSVVYFACRQVKTEVPPGKYHLALAETKDTQVGFTMCYAPLRAT